MVNMSHRNLKCEWNIWYDIDLTYNGIWPDKIEDRQEIFDMLSNYKMNDGGYGDREDERLYDLERLIQAANIGL